MGDVAVSLYLDLLKRCIVNQIYQDPGIRSPWDDASEDALTRFDLKGRLEGGGDWPSQAHTMIGMRRLENIQTLAEDVLRTQTPGDFIETGVWRGGSTILMRGILKAHGIRDRAVWVADSFAGFPSTEEEGASSRSFNSPELVSLRGYQHSSLPEKVRTSFDLVSEGTSYEEVRDHFARYGLLDDQVKFLRGWFCDTLPSAPIERLALLRLDGDLYDSTYDALQALYPRLSVGGYTIVDDYSFFIECRQAVHDYLDATNADAEIQRVDDEAVFWQKFE
jgi:hypothetical protein